MSTRRQRRAAKQRKRTADRRRQSNQESVRRATHEDAGPRGDHEDLRRQTAQRLRFVLAIVGAVPQSAHDQAKEPFAVTINPAELVADA